MVIKGAALPKYVHHKVAKGNDYYYFDTGRKEDGKRIFVRLPGLRDPRFARAYSVAMATRSRQFDAPKDVRSFDWLMRAYEASPEFQKLAKGSKSNYLSCLNVAKAAFCNGEGQSWPLHIITAEHMLALRDKYVDKPGRANLILGAVGAMYAWALKPGRKFVTSNITHGIGKLECGEHEPWPEQLIEDALADPEVRLPVALLYFTGQRLGDVVTMGKTHVRGGSVSVVQEKTGKELAIPLHKRLAEIIAMDEPNNIRFLVRPDGKPMNGDYVRRVLQGWATSRGQKVVPHGLRKNAVNALLECGCSVAEVAAITGQSLQMIEHYAKKRNQERLAQSAILKFEARNGTGT